MAKEKKRNFWLGILGALVGALLGSGAIILLGQARVFSAIAGVAMAVLTLRFCYFFGGKLSNTSLVICLILMACSIYLADRVNWTIAIMRAYEGATPWASFCSVYALIEKIDDYITNLGFLYTFAALGCFWVLRRPKTPAAKQNAMDEKPEKDVQEET
ncbi:MAG: hypothetical protein E7462_02055 [Ruminococcaceae bacterium]|nr:hypothetical protein [Oscillospiraceae bacterium]